MPLDRDDREKARALLRTHVGAMTLELEEYVLDRLAECVTPDESAAWRRQLREQVDAYDELKAEVEAAEAKLARIEAQCTFRAPFQGAVPVDVLRAILRGDQ